VSGSLRAYGIDLGTTNSSLAVVDAPSSQVGLPPAEVVEIAQPALDGTKISAVVPSVVACYDGQLWVGEGARGLRALAGDSSKNIVRYRSLFYECKNEIGTSRSYAGELGIEGPVDVAAQVLKCIRDAGVPEGYDDKVVVTVPASFQMQQRLDTLRACEKAGLRLDAGSLMDEPCAAFVDYLVRHGDSLGDLSQPRNLLVIDFGGGTCDVAVFQVQRTGVGPIRMKSMAVSRYHRLGGADIDLAIVHRVLMPALRKESGLSDFDVDFEEIQARFVPALQPVAEALKIQLSNEMWRREAFGQSPEQVNSSVARFPQATTIVSKKLGKTLTLPPESATLSGEQFLSVLEPFLSIDRLAPAQFEYRLECSMFAPVMDAIERTGLAPADMHYLLSVGGSAILPPVEQALRNVFRACIHLRFEDRTEFQYAVARGAAVQAWHLAAHGVGLIQPVAQEDILLAVAGGELSLVKAGTVLPFPEGGGDELVDALAVPEDARTRSLLVAFRIITGRDRRVVATGTLDVGGAPKGHRIVLGYRFDENQVFSVAARLKGVDGGAELKLQIQNPVSNVVNPNAKLEEREQLIEQLRRTPDDWKDLMPRIAALCAELSYQAEAIVWLERYQRKQGQQDSWSLNLQGIYEADRGNADGAIRRYRQAASLPGASSAPLFNMALALRDKGQLADALKAVDEAFAKREDPSYLTLRLTLLEKLGKTNTLEKDAKAVLKGFEPVEQLSDFSLAWLAVAARLANATDVQAEVQSESRKRQVQATASMDGVLPMVAKD
jgi:molecular chaperone DnaK